MSEVDKHFYLPSLNGYRLAIGHLRMVNSGVETYLRFPSVILLWISLREFVFGSVGRPVGKIVALIPRAATQTTGYVMEIKLVWFGSFKIQFWVLCSAIPGACPASLFPIHR